MQFGQCAVTSATVRGVEVIPVTVEVVVSGGLPGMAIVGMPDAAIQEARERVKAAADRPSLDQRRAVRGRAFPRRAREAGGGRARVRHLRALPRPRFCMRLRERSGAPR